MDYNTLFEPQVFVKKLSVKKSNEITARQFLFITAVKEMFLLLAAGTNVYSIKTTCDLYFFGLVTTLKQTSTISTIFSCLAVVFHSLNI